MPYGVRSPRTARCSSRLTGSTSHAGEYSIPIASSVVGTGPSCRGMMFGGVRIASRTVAAPPSARSAAISAPELPAPTTSTSRPAKAPGVPVLRRVHDLAPESLLARPVRPNRGVAVSGGDHDLPRRERAVVEGRGPQPSVMVHSPHLGREPRRDPLAPRVDAQVLGHVVLRHPASESSGNAHAGQGRLHPRSVQVQSVVPRPPGLTHAFAAIDDQGVDSPAQQARGHGQAGRPRADDEHLGVHPRHRQRSIHVAESRAHRRGGSNAVGPAVVRERRCRRGQLKAIDLEALQVGRRVEGRPVRFGFVGARQPEQFGGDATQRHLDGP